MRQVYLKYGPNINIDGIQIFRPSYSRKEFVPVIDDELQIVPTLSSSHKSLARLLKSACSKCGSMYKVEMHHIRKMADLYKEKADIRYMIAKANRKQIALCRKCHMEAHRKI
jgi:hypothetical protein